MKHYKHINQMAILLLSLLLLFVPSVLSQTPYTISWWTVDGGGRESSGGVYTIADTVGQPDASSLPSSDNGRFSMTDGFWPYETFTPPVNQPKLIYLPIISE